MGPHTRTRSSLFPGRRRASLPPRLCISLGVDTVETGLSKCKSGASKQINLGTSTQPESETTKKLMTSDVSLV